MMVYSMEGGYNMEMEGRREDGISYTDCMLHAKMKAKRRHGS